MEDLDLPVPRMIIDDAYVGEPPKVEVTMDNLNDNIDRQFLSEKLKKFGEWEELHIDYHPVTKKHLGLARIVFKQVRAAKECVAALHSKSMMGKQVNCYLDPRGLMAKKMFEDLTTEKKPSPLPPDEEPDLPDLPEDENVAVGGEYDDRLGMWDRDGESRWDGWDGDRERGWPGEEEKGWEGRRPKHWQEEETQGAWSERGEYEGRNHRSRWDNDDRSDGRYGGGGRRERGREERRNTRWDRDRNSRDMETDSRSRDSHRKYDGDRESRGGWGERGETEWKQPQYWGDAAANYAANNYDHEEPVVPAVDATDQVAVTAAANNTDSEADNRKIDLDTRLQLLMKDKSANMPAFLIGSDSSEEDAPAPPPPPPKPHPGPLPPLSRDPSPFLSHQAYMDSYLLTNQQEELDRVNSALANIPLGRGGAMSRQSDKMSLSPLSEGGMGEIEQPQPFPGQPGYWPGAHWGGTGYPNSWAGGYPGHPGHHSAGGVQGGDHYWQYPDHNAGWGDGSGVQYQYEEQEKQTKAKKKYEGKDPYRAVIDNVVHIVEKELKQILKRDINKRICETYAFLLYDNWWSEQEVRHKEKVEKELVKTKQQAPTPVIVPDREIVAELPRIPKPEDLSSLIDKRRANLGNKGAQGQGGSLGLGFRGIIPKIPKVHKQPRTPSPEASDKGRKGEKVKHKDRREKGGEAREKSPKKKEKRKEKEAAVGKGENSKATAASVYKDIYGESDGESDKEGSAESSEIESSDTEESESSQSEASQSDSDSDSDSDEKASVASKSRSSSPSKSGSGSPRSKSSSPVRSVPVTPSKPSTPRSRSASSSSSSPTPSAPPTPTLPSPARPAVSPRRSALAKIADSCTDSADDSALDVEVVDNNDGSATKAAEALLSLSNTSSAPPAPGTPCSMSAPITTPSTPSTPVKVQHVVSSPPHIMDHCYARRSRHSSSDSQSPAASDRRGQGDHDYTKPRTPPRAAPPPTPGEASNKEKDIRALQARGRKPKPSRPALPVKPVKFKPRENVDKFKIIYKFLTDGIDAEDTMYLKRSYELVCDIFLLMTRC